MILLWTLFPQQYTLIVFISNCATKVSQDFAISEISLILVSQNKQTKTLNDMAKVQKIWVSHSFWRIFSIMEQFDALWAPTIDSTLGLRCTQYGYQYSKILRSLMCVYLYGYTCSKEIVEVVETNCRHFCIRANRYSSFNDSILSLTCWNTVEINNIEFELNSILIDEWKGKPYRLAIQQQRERRNTLMFGKVNTSKGAYWPTITSRRQRHSEFYNLRSGKQRIFDEMNNDFRWKQLSKSFMA